jgi:hypothetical protein
MSQGITISLPKSEQDKFRAWVRKQTAETRAKCQQVVMRHTFDLERRAKISAPANKKTGEGAFLRSQIHHVFTSDRLGGEVYTNVKYAPYQEFGTGRFAPMGILPGYEAYARQFKGRGIRKVNIRPRMYLYPHFERIKKIFIRDLNNMGFK